MNLNLIEKENELKRLTEEKNELIKSNRTDLLFVTKKFGDLEECMGIEGKSYSCCVDEKSSEILMLQYKLDEQRNNFVKLQKVFDDLSDMTELNLEVLNHKFSQEITSIAKYFDEEHIKLQINTKVDMQEFFNNACSEMSKLESNITLGLRHVKEIKNNIMDKTDSFIKNYEEYDKMCLYLFEKLCKTESERDDLILVGLEKSASVEEKLDKCKDLQQNLDIVRLKCTNFEITVGKMLDTIKVLSERLFASETEVERLNNVLQQNNSLKDKVSFLINECLGVKKIVSKMQIEITDDLICTKNNFIDHLEFIRESSLRDILNLKEEIAVRNQDLAKKDQLVLDCRKTIDEMKESFQQADCFKNILETEKKDLEVKLSEMALKEKILKRQILEESHKSDDLTKEIYIKNDMLQNEMDKVESLEKKLNTSSNCYENLLLQFDHLKKNEPCLIKQLQQNDILILDYEARLRKSDQATISVLQEHIASLEKENLNLIEIQKVDKAEINKLDQQLVELIGHHNVRQRIRHVEKLKLENRALKEELEKLTKKQNGTIKKVIFPQKENREINLHADSSNGKIMPLKEKNIQRKEEDVQ
uniref:Hyaluronan-mediated motility receptor C-terminal domain-containing protein n=1 Tax=Clastoptera arizonana TaxID=38151 RepID=A0A1B6DGD2_9HEMI